MTRKCRPCWINCFGPDDTSFVKDKEVLAIDAMEDALGGVNAQATKIRQLIAGFEACYHEADKEAERIIRAIGAGRCPRQSTARPPKRRRELQNSRTILSNWCEDPPAIRPRLRVGGVSARDLINFIGRPTSLKIWQVRRIIDKLTEALYRSRPYNWMAFDLGDYGEPGARRAGEAYQDNADLLQQTKDTMIRNTEDGKDAPISLAIAIDLFQPCHWDFVGGLVTLLKAIGGDLHPARPYAYCGLNVKLSPLCPRLETIANTLRTFSKPEETIKDTDPDLLAALGQPTPEKRWLAASLDKTIRLHLYL